MDFENLANRPVLSQLAIKISEVMSDLDSQTNFKNGNLMFSEQLSSQITEGGQVVKHINDMQDIFLAEYGSNREGSEGTAVRRDEQPLFSWRQDVS